VIATAAAPPEIGLDHLTLHSPSPVADGYRGGLSKEPFHG
jgi:hypothetical protein